MVGEPDPVLPGGRAEAAGHLAGLHHHPRYLLLRHPLYLHLPQRGNLQPLYLYLPLLLLGAELLYESLCLKVTN